MNFQSILIVTYARSGSTLLQGMINSIDGVLIRGENQNFIQGLHETYLRLKKTRHMCVRHNFKNHKHYSNTTSPWYGANLLDIPLFLNYCQSMIRDLLLADYQQDKSINCYGFKEIRYYYLIDSKIELKDYLDFLNKVFPQAAFIFNVRHLDDVLKSILWRDLDESITRPKLLKLESEFKAYHQLNPENTFLISYENVISKSEKLKSLFTFLGAEYLESKVDNILNTPHSF